MMTIKALKGAGQARGYYESEKGIAGYYDHDSAFGGGKWMGQGAETLGMRGAVGVNQFEKALNGHLPGGIEIAHKTDGTHRPGVDLTFSAPKSVSILALAANDQRLIAAHDRAVEKTLRWIEDNHVYARLGGGGTERQITGNLAAAAFRHVTARPVNGITDPQLHTHVVAINATQRTDGKWVSANLGMDQDWIKAAGAIYRMELAREIATLGYGIEQIKDGFELKGVSRETIERFSCRSSQIEAELQRQGKTRATASASEKDAVNLKTRHGKEKSDGAELRAEWSARAQAAGIEQVKEAAQTRVSAGPIPTDHQAVTVTAAAAVQSAVRHLSERESAFTESALLGAAAGFGGLGKVSINDLEKALQKEIAEGRLLMAVPHPNPKPWEEGKRYTSQQAISREKALITRIERGKDAVASIKDTVADKLTTAKGEELNQQQVAVAKHILTSPDRFVQVQGGAGVGKTTSMDVVCTEAKAAGLAVVGLAQTHKAKNGMADAGIEEVKTIALAVREFRSGAAPENTLFIIDEASMASMKDVAELVRAVERTGNRAAVIGDLYQHSAVEAGSGFRLMQEVGGKVELNEIVRQRNLELRECVHAFMTGNAVLGAQLAAKFMIEVPVDQIASEAAARYVALTPEERKEYLIPTGTNAMRREINAHVREGLKEKGVIGKEDMTLKHLEKVDFTQEQVRHVHNYQTGQVVQFQRDYMRGVSEPIARDHQYEIKEIDKEHHRIKLVDKETGHEIDWKPRTAGKVTISKQDELEVSKGDRVVFRANDRENGLRNGDHGTVKNVRRDGMIEVELNKGGTVAIDPLKATHVELAYAGTTNSLQSATANQITGAMPSGSLTATAEQAYVTLSRARDGACVITDNKAALIKAWSQWRGKENALEVVAEKTATQEQEKGQSHDRARDQAPTREFSR